MSRYRLGSLAQQADQLYHEHTAHRLRREYAARHGMANVSREVRDWLDPIAVANRESHQDFWDMKYRWRDEANRAKFNKRKRWRTLRGAGARYIRKFMKGKRGRPGAAYSFRGRVSFPQIGSGTVPRHLHSKPSRDQPWESYDPTFGALKGAAAGAVGYGLGKGVTTFLGSAADAATSAFGRGAGELASAVGAMGIPLGPMSRSVVPAMVAAGPLLYGAGQALYNLGSLGYDMVSNAPNFLGWVPGSNGQ